MTIISTQARTQSESWTYVDPTLPGHVQVLQANRDGYTLAEARELAADLNALLRVERPRAFRSLVASAVGAAARMMAS